MSWREEAGRYVGDASDRPEEDGAREAMVARRKAQFSKGKRDNTTVSASEQAARGGAPSAAAAAQTDEPEPGDKFAHAEVVASNLGALHESTEVSSDARQAMIDRRRDRFSKKGTR